MTSSLDSAQTFNETFNNSKVDCVLAGYESNKYVCLS